MTRIIDRIEGLCHSARVARRGIFLLRRAAIRVLRLAAGWKIASRGPLEYNH